MAVVHLRAYQSAAPLKPGGRVPDGRPPSYLRAYQSAAPLKPWLTFDGADDFEQISALTKARPR